MSKRSGRPSKGDENNSKEKIIYTTIAIIREKGADAVTVRNVCSEAGLSIGTFYHYFRDKDDLLMHFLKETSFESIYLMTPLSDIAGRITELYMFLISKYMDFGLDFMKSFYSTGNRSLSAYMGEVEGAFAPGTVMARSETELQSAIEHGYLSKKTDVHELGMDICTIVKGCVFEWCLTDGNMDIHKTLERIISAYLRK
ncbi:MAG: TetR/AcrR family transcriptional regulator [Acidaminococcaceae bacterium]|nr:TetR/AcrR family transcriptional regulator [Acidaminococcaceae bacterium]MBR1590250.1 TetR/AcrR family transcriptional regulator [Acidaminococcaceae bacterium]